MATKPNEAADVNAELATLRADIARLSDSIAQLLQREADEAATRIRTGVGRAADVVTSVADDVKRTGRQMAADAQEGVRSATSELEASIERNPLTAVLIAAGVGLVFGLMSRKG
jgi:ElaB/YqjD/DUF883 family membrane-anchored ribosome-binding protein